MRLRDVLSESEEQLGDATWASSATWHDIGYGAPAMLVLRLLKRVVDADPPRAGAAQGSSGTDDACSAPVDVLHAIQPLADVIAAVAESTDASTRLRGPLSSLANIQNCVSAW